MKKKLFIISGGPGFGKTKIIHHLEKIGYKAGSEYAREIIAEQLQKDGDVLPWKNTSAFQQEVLKRRISFYNSVDEGQLAFADRGIPDQLAFAKYRGFKVSQSLEESIQQYDYAKFVFITHPWEDIYQTDSIRKESFKEACEMHEVICEVYRQLDYILVDVPQVDVICRAHFLVDYIHQFDS